MKHTKANRITNWRMKLQPRVSKPRKIKPKRSIRPIRQSTPPILNLDSTKILEHTELQNLIKIGAIIPKNASMTNVMTAGKIPKPVRALLLLALSNPYTSSTKAAMDAASYLQSEINKKKKKNKTLK